MMQNFGLEDLSHVQSRRNLLKYLVRVEMASDWFKGVLVFGSSFSGLSFRVLGFGSSFSALITKMNKNKENKGVLVFGS